MRAVIQRVASASVAVDGETLGRIDRGLLVLLGVQHGDGPEDLNWLVPKIARMRLFPDDAGKMNRSLAETGGGLLAISQFTLHASTRKGNRPSFLEAAAPDVAKPLYLAFMAAMEKELGRSVARGRFGANMQVSLVNDGPVTVIVDSRLRE